MVSEKKKTGRKVWQGEKWKTSLKDILLWENEVEWEGSRALTFAIL